MASAQYKVITPILWSVACVAIMFGIVDYLDHANAFDLTVPQRSAIRITLLASSLIAPFALFFDRSRLTLVVVLVPLLFTLTSMSRSITAPKPMTLAQCKEAAQNSEAVKKRLEGMDDANRTAGLETAAMRCVLDHDPESANWSEDKKTAVIAHAYCEKEANGNGFIQYACETMWSQSIEQMRKYGRDAISTPPSLKEPK